MSAETDNVDFLDQICPKRYFQSKTEKVNITITMEVCIFELVLSTKLQLKQIILSSWTKFTPKRYFQKTEQPVQGLQAFAFCVVNVNSAVVFKHFEDLIILMILEEKLVMSCLLGSFCLKIV